MKLNREESRKNELEGFFCELQLKHILWNFVENDNLIKIRIDTSKGRILNPEIKRILQGYEREQELLSLLNEMQGKGWHLPDFILRLEDKGDIGIVFCEVKKMPKKFKFSGMTEKKAIGLLNERDFMTIIFLIKIPIDRENISEERAEIMFSLVSCYNKGLMNKENIGYSNTKRKRTELKRIKKNVFLWKREYENKKDNVS